MKRGILVTVQIDWDKLTFRLTPAKTMFINHCRFDEPWKAGRYVPYGPIRLSPAAAVLNYGQGIFEGLKARRTKQNNIVLFRPIENAKRLAIGATRTSMPPYPIEDFVTVMHEIVRRNIEYVPPYKKGSLYIRPCLWGTGEILGVAPSSEYTFLTFVSPVGSYYHGDLEPIKLVVSDVHRAAPKGLGNIKFIGNYAGGLQPANAAKARGYSGCVYLDAKEERYVEEVGTSNFFCVINGELLTPSLNSILPGITRESVIQLARDVLKLTVIERNISIDEALSAEECFCTGTAAVVTPIGVMHYKNKDTTINNFEVGPYTRQLYELLTGIQLGDREDTFHWISSI